MPPDAHSAALDPAPAWPVPAIADARRPPRPDQRRRLFAALLLVSLLLPLAVVAVLLLKPPPPLPPPRAAPVRPAPAPAPAPPAATRLPLAWGSNPLAWTKPDDTNVPPTRRPSGSVDLSLGPAARNSKGAAPRGAHDRDFSMRAEGA